MMTWAQQVRHVFVKDARDSRWLLFAYAALLALGVAEVVAALHVLTGELPLGSVALRATGGLISASIVLADAPFNPRAQWASLPFARSAVFAAKCVIVVLLLMFTGAAVAIALRAFDVPFAELSRPVALSLVPLAALLVATALAASVERSLRAVLVVLLAAVPVFLLLTWLAGVALRSRVLGVSVSNAIMFTTALLGLALMIALVRARRVRVPLRVGVMAVATLLVGIQLTPADADSYTPRAPSSGAMANATLIHDAADRATGGDSVRLLLRIAGLTSSQRVEWLPSSVRTTRPSGDSGTSAILSAGFMLNNPVLPLPAGLTWMGAHPRHDAGLAVADTVREWQTPLPGQMRKALTGDVLGATVHGTVELREPRVFGRLPLTANARLTHHGRQFTVVSASQRAHPEVDVTFESVLRDSRNELKHYTFVLQNSTRREAVRMDWPERSSSRDAWLLAPSAALRTGGRLVPTYAGITPAGWEQLSMTVVQFDGAWLGESELVIIEWVLVGSVPVVAELRGSAPDARRNQP